MFDRERKEEIIKYIISIFVDELKYFFKDVKFVQKERENLARECLIFQFYYDSSVNKIYLYYELDKRLKSLDNVNEIYKNINMRLYNNSYKDKEVFIDILNCSGRIKFKETVYMSEHYEYLLGPYTFSYWRCFDGMYRFVEDTPRLISDHNIFFDSEPNKERIDKEKEFFNHILELNKKYDFNGVNNKESVQQAFEEYKKLYFDFYNRELNVINQDEITYIYCDAYYKD